MTKELDQAFRTLNKMRRAIGLMTYNGRGSFWDFLNNFSDRKRKTPEKG